MEAVRPALPDASLNLVKNYIAIEVNGNNYMGLHKRSSPRSLMWLWVTEENFDEATRLLDKAGFPYIKRSNNQSLRVTVDKAAVTANAEIIAALAQLLFVSRGRNRAN